ncbi:AAA family ATPase [Paracoccus sanguinis]|uniref:AAA family ATPase n=1 Tax=Paracoccus sanguinis TaxID=1545044 RepID=UPI000690B679|nr:AAA family ATPase [Paracoccus sanguinis]
MKDDDLDEWLYAEQTPAAPRPLTVREWLDSRPVGKVLKRDGALWCRVANAAATRFDDPKSRAAVESLIAKLNQPMRLNGPRSQHRIHEAVSRIHETSPWLAPVSQFLMSQFQSLWDAGAPFWGFGPVLLVGEPGCGKTHYAHAVAEALGSPLLRLDGSSMVSVFQIAGTERGWSSASASPIIRLIADRAVANPVVILDEVEKCGTGSTGGSPHSALLGMLEPVSNSVWRCPFTEAHVDLSRVSWIFTANDLAAVPAPLVDRCRVFRVPPPGPAEVADFVRGRLAGVDGAVVDQVVRAAQGASLRRVNRMIQAVLAAGKERRLLH